MLECKTTKMVYIGQTINENPFGRLSGHRSNVKTGSMPKLHDAMKLYGFDDFEFIPIACVLKQKNLGSFEAELIKQFDSEANGYNTQGPIRWAKSSYNTIRNGKIQKILKECLDGA